MMTANKRPYAIVYHYTDKDYNEDTGWISVFYTKEELDEFTQSCDMEYIYTGHIYYVYRLK